MGDILGKVVGNVLLIAMYVVLWASVDILLAFPVMWCWNYAVVAVWKLPAITWGQAWCLLFLAGMLIKSSTSSSKK